MKCPGCEATRAAIESICPVGMNWIVGLPKESLPPHSDNCPAREPCRALGMEFWTYAEEREP